MRYRSPILLVLLPFAGGYFLSYFYRTINSVIAAELSSSMQLRASDLGLLTAAVGVALDRYGPRRVQGVLLLVPAIGAALFGIAHSLAAFIVGRALIV
jgi:sugar phosphate permease